VSLIRGQDIAAPEGRALLWGPSAPGAFITDSDFIILSRHTAPPLPVLTGQVCRPVFLYFSIVFLEF
jgi:hypothetical protein